jgi:outer membrane protein OmpA-like peptidoglycan-associated protein
MKRTALFFASTAILFSSPYAMAEQPPLNRPFISSNTNVPSELLAQADEAAPQANPDQELKKSPEEARPAAPEPKAKEEPKQPEAKPAPEAEAKKPAENEPAQAAEKAKPASEAEPDKAPEKKAVEEEAPKQKASEPEAPKAKEQAKEAEKVEKPAIKEEDKAAEEKPLKKRDHEPKSSEAPTEKVKKEADKAAEETPTKPTSETAEKPATEKPAVAPDPAAGEKPAKSAREPKPENPAEPATGKPAAQQVAPSPEHAAPVLDSDKPAPVREGKERGKDGKSRVAKETPATPGETAVAPPKSDAEVQQKLAPVTIKPALSEKGTRTKEHPRDERPDDVQVIKKFGTRTVVGIDNDVYVESSDRPRMSHGAKDVYYEDLPRNRTRETITRDNGARIVTIRNRYGDVVQRSHVMPNGREVVLSYSADDDRDERRQWRDPGDDLPPLRLRIPTREYILDADEAPQEEVYEFFEQPPVERVERTYSIDEVKRSARIRDKIRRVDLDTITFPFGSAVIAEDQISRIEGVAKAMAQTLKKNPAETFLIEGHTDAVGSDQANLVLSDERAESVAQALTNVFGIPPENMATQGYGERYLKIKSEEPERQNRRVAIRRITPLVAPMASNN